MDKDKDYREKFMRIALRLAQKAQGQTSPNPLVGALVVKKGRVIGQGYHRAAGLEHAEVAALNEAGKAAQGASLYVSLEPCCHYGRTAPCVHKIVASGIREVTFAMYDPNPLTKGKGAQFLRRHGIKIVPGVLQDEAGKINQVFIKYITQKLPFVTVKIAQSLDGKIATRSGDSRWITSLSSREWVHRLRSRVDAILVGVNTVLKDDPLLNCRLNGKLYKRQPKKIIVDSRLRLLPNLNIFSSRSPAPIIVATSKFAPPLKVADFRKRGIQVIIAKDAAKRVDLVDLFKRLAEQEIAHVLIEGGGEIIASALKERLVDRMIVFLSPKIIGGRAAPTAVEGEGLKKVSQATKLKEMRFRRLGSDFIVEAKLA